MKKKMSLATVCAFVWFGHACGASMATGRLAVQYFSLHGPIGLIGPLAVWITTVGFAWIIMEYGRLIRANNYHEVVNSIYWPNKTLGSVMNIVWDVTVLFSTIVVSGTCVAGTGAVLESVLGLNYNIGMALFVLLLLVLFLTGGGIIKKLGNISLPLLIMLVVMCIVIISMGWDNLMVVLKGDLNEFIEPGRETLSSVIKDGVTLGMTQSGFIATGIVYSRQFKSRRETTHACVLALILGCLALTMCTVAVLSYFPVVNDETLPFLTVLKEIPGVPGFSFRAIYYVILLIAYVSTSGSLVFGAVSRYKLILGKVIKNEKVCTGILVVFFLSASIIIGALGLKAIVDRGYKILGSVRTYTWFYPLLILGPVSIHRVAKMLKEKGKIEFENAILPKQED